MSGAEVVASVYLVGGFVAAVVAAVHWFLEFPSSRGAGALLVAFVVCTAIIWPVIVVAAIPIGLAKGIAWLLRPDTRAAWEVDQ